MPGKLGGKSLSLAASLRLVVRAQQAEAEAVAERKLQEAEAEAEAAAGAGGGFGAPGGMMRRPTVPPLRRGGRTAAVRLRDLPKSPPVAEVMHALKEVSDVPGGGGRGGVEMVITLKEVSFAISVILLQGPSCNFQFPCTSPSRSAVPI